MKIYDLVTIMKRAHSIKNKSGCTFSQHRKHKTTNNLPLPTGVNGSNPYSGLQSFR